MKKTLVLAAIIAAAALAFCGGSKADELNKKQQETYFGSVGVITQTAWILGEEMRAKPLGGAVLITPNVVVTAAHVPPKNMSAYVTEEVTFSNKKCGAKVIKVLAYDALSDIAVLMLDKKPPCMSVAKISSKMSVGGKICAKRNIEITHMTTYSEVYSEDISCSFVNRVMFISGSEYVIFNSKNLSEPGFSGFPVLDKNGEVLGLVSGGLGLFTNITHIGNITKMSYLKN